MNKIQTAERVSKSPEDNYVFARSLLAYIETAKIVTGKVLEIGTGSGYGLKYLSDRVEHLLTIDKFDVSALTKNFPNVSFKQMNIPPLLGLRDNFFDYVVSFQVIEHIENDTAFVSETHRVLKPGGSLILTTPNKLMSLTRNPWHVREYTIDELKALLQSKFEILKCYGVFGNENIMEYYEKNRKSIEKINRLDIFNLQYKLPRWALQIPYDILNRWNRKKLLSENYKLTVDISIDDYFVDQATTDCIDLFYIAKKSMAKL